MKEIYYQSRETGELQPMADAIVLYAWSHPDKLPQYWRTEWEPTPYEVDRDEE